jgi:SAM-dependent methyltransferase
VVNRKTLYTIKRLLPNPLITKAVKYRTMYNILREFGGRHPRHCPICGYSGFFSAYGQPLQPDAMCPRCRSVGRHRQHHLLVRQHNDWIEGKSILHFAPEPAFVDDYAKRAALYVQADYSPARSEVQVDMQAIQYEEGTFDTIIAHNILEHVPDDRKALSELNRVLKRGGRALLSAPVIEAWPDTYEDMQIKDPWERDLHFNQWDHLRLYGRDIRDRIHAAGFDLLEYVAREPDVSHYGLLRGETIFIAIQNDVLDRA